YVVAERRHLLRKGPGLPIGRSATAVSSSSGSSRPHAQAQQRQSRRAQQRAAGRALPSFPLALANVPFLPPVLRAKTRPSEKQLPNVRCAHPPDLKMNLEMSTVSVREMTIVAAERLARSYNSSAELLRAYR